MMKPGGPGWNDPPQLSHKVHSETKCRRNVLDQRIAYLGYSPNKSNAEETLSPNLPPPTNPVVTKIQKSISNTTIQPSDLANIFVPNVDNSPKIDITLKDAPEEGTSCSTDKETKINDDNKNTASTPAQKLVELTNVKDAIFQLFTLVDTCKTDKNKVAVIDMEKKLNIFQEAFDSGTLSEPVSNDMIKLTTNLLNKEYEKAWDIHVALMCDHISEVRLWMVGVKRLITELKNNSNKQ